MVKDIINCFFGTSGDTTLMELFSDLSLSPNLPLLFLVSFLAATILPLGSEWLLILMLSGGFGTAEVVTVASCGNFLGSCTTFLIGQYGSHFIIEKVLRIGPAQQQRAEDLYTRYGSWSLFLSWLPVVGDPICLIAGVFKVGWMRFSLLVFLGKFCRYATVAYLTEKALTL